MSLVPDLSSVGMVVDPSPPPSTRTPTQKKPRKTREGLEKRKTARKREVRLSRLRQHTMTPIYTRSASASICIFKKNTLPSFLVCSVCVFAWQGCAHVEAMCQGEQQQFICVSFCVSHVLTHTRTVKWASYGPV